MNKEKYPQLATENNQQNTPQITQVKRKSVENGMQKMKNDKKLAKSTVKGIENMKMNTKQLHDSLMKRIDSIEMMIKSLDERERIIQRTYERLDQKVQDFIVSENEKKSDTRWMTATFITIVIFIVSTIINLVK